MISETEIEVALTGALLAGFPAESIAWPNQFYDGEKPYLFVQVDRGGQRDVALKGGVVISPGRLAVTVVDALGKGTRASNELADKVAALFPMATRIPAGDATIVINRAPDVRDGFRDDGDDKEADWRTPVLLWYEAH